MKRYFYIPIEHEEILTQAIDYWNQNGEYSILTGVYISRGKIIAGESTVKSKNILQEIVTYPYTFENNNLIGFCLEGYLEEVAPYFYDMICGLPDIMQFETNIEYLEFEKTL